MSLIKSDQEIERLRAAGHILAQTLKEVVAAAQEGVRLLDLDALARSHIEAVGARPGFLGYQPVGATRPYPATICASLNEVVVHGVPTERRLQSGDLLSIDLGVLLDGYYADGAVTIGIGSISDKARRLIIAANRALDRAIAAVRPGVTLGDLGYIIERSVTKDGFTVVEGLTGHGIGTALHEEPSVFNSGRPGKGLKLEPGMALAIEPMISAGSGTIVQGQDEGYATADGSLSAHAEHTIIVTSEGVEVVTK